MLPPVMINFLPWLLPFRPLTWLKPSLVKARLLFFAPTNAAFAALPPEALNALLEPANKDLLTEVLTYHVVADELGADSVVTASTLETLNGPVDVDVVDGEVMVNQANVILADVDASNGVIHAIDAVLIPDGVIATLETRMAETEMAPTAEPATTDEPVRGLW